MKTKHSPGAAALSANGKSSADSVVPLAFNHLHLSSALQKRKGEGGRERGKKGGREKKRTNKEKRRVASVWSKCVCQSRIREGWVGGGGVERGRGVQPSDSAEIFQEERVSV